MFCFTEIYLFFYNYVKQVSIVNVALGAIKPSKYIYFVERKNLFRGRKRTFSKINICNV